MEGFTEIKNKKIAQNSLLLPSYFLLILIIILMVTSTALPAMQDEIKRQIQIINPLPNFFLSLRLDKGIGATYAPGEMVGIFIKPSKDSYVTIYGYDSLGNVNLLFPNLEQRNSLLNANRETYIEYTIRRDDVPGMEYIQGFATIEPVLISGEMERMFSSNHMPRLPEKVNKFTREVESTLINLPPSQWVSSDILNYRVIERRPGVGRINIESQPAGADILLNGMYIGQTPLEMELWQIGEYQVRVELDGYNPWHDKVLINNGRTTFVSADLIGTGQPGSISIISNVDIGRVYLDEQFKRLTQSDKEIVIEEVVPGFHTIRISLAGYDDWRDRVEVRSNHRIQLYAELEKIIVEGYQDYSSAIRIPTDRFSDDKVQKQEKYQKIEGEAVVVYCNEEDARIFIDGAFRTTTLADKAVVIGDLSEGVYDITVIKEGYRIWQEEVAIRSGEMVSVFADLVRLNR